MARWTASAKWAEGPALDGQCAMPLGLRLSEGLGVARGVTLQVRRREARTLCDSREHARTDFFTVMECESKVSPTLTGERAMRTGSSFHRPPQLQQRRQNNSGLLRRPLAHAAAGRAMLMLVGLDSPCSSRSAMTRSASVSTLMIASSFDDP